MTSKRLFILCATIALIGCNSASKQEENRATFNGVPLRTHINDFWEQYRQSVSDDYYVDSAMNCGIKAYIDVVNKQTNDTLTIMTDLYNDTVYCVYYAVSEDSVFAVTDSIGYERYLATRK
jgi:nicotinamide riboside kinase